MPSPVLSIIRGGQPAPSARQKSFANAFAPQGGRGRGAGAVRRVSGAVTPTPEAMRCDFPSEWARLVQNLYRGPAAISRALGVTEQTARNWLAETCRPTGDKVALVALRHPEAFARFIGGR